MKKIILAIFLIALTLFCATKAHELENTLLRKKIGQMLIIGFDGTKLTPDNPIVKDIEQERISGVILFSKNANKTKNIEGGADIKNIQSKRQLKELVSDLQRISPNKLFVAIDEEGGKISRLSDPSFKLKTLSHKELGDKNDTMTTYLEAKKIAQTLKELGINLNFAPCVDLGINPNSKIIYQKNRAFSAQSDIVVNHANSYILAHQQFGIETALKHFPGHGSTSDDTHKNLADSTKNWTREELAPYQALINNGSAQNIMISHVFNKNLDDTFPASMSYKTVTELLRKKMGFDGLIITDDMQMKAITDNWGFDEAIINSINAGCDIIILGNNLEYDKDIAQKFNDIVFNAVQEGKITQKRIDDSYYRIIAKKAQL